MKQVHISKLKELAIYYGGTLTGDLYPAIEFNEGYGIEATEVDSEGNCSGFRFYGPVERQEAVLDLWTELTEDTVQGIPLTPELAKQLIGKNVTVWYRNNSGHEAKMDILIKDVYSTDQKAIGQATTHRLRFIEDGSENNYIYEWQGIFRVTGSAHVVYLKQLPE